MTVTLGPEAGKVDSPVASKRMAWLDILRAVAVLLVIWDHFTGGVLNALGRTWLPSTVVSSVVFDPLAITQFGGFMGVALFFMISGYIISVVLRRETNRTFILRRVFRIFPMLALMIVVVILTNPPQIQGMSLGHVIQVGLENLTLLNYLRSPQVVLIGVAWTLAIELVFYLVALILKPLLTRTPVKLMFPAALIAVSAVMIATSRVFGGGPYFQLSVFFIYIPIFAIGSIFALRDSNEIRAMWGWLLGALAFGVFLYGTRNFYPQFLVPTDSYPISAIYVVVIFGVAWVFRESIPRIRVMSAIALISYSLYLVHGVIGQPVLRWLVEYQNWSYTAAFFLAVAITFALSTATYLVIEQPANTLARRLTSRRPGQTE